MSITSLFWAAFYFCLDLPIFWHVSYKLIGKYFSTYFFPLFFFFFPLALFSRCNVIMHKKLWPFVSPSTKELQRKQLGNLTFFCIHYFSKTKGKPVKKKKYREMFSYQFVADMPNIRQI